VRRVAPLAALRAAYEPAPARRDPLRWLAGLGLAAWIAGFAVLQSPDWRVGLGCAAGIGAVFLALAGAAWSLSALARHVLPSMLPFSVRQGVSNLHRPNNRTLLMLMSLGLGTFLLLCLYLVQQTLLTQLFAGGGKDRANAVLFDIQTSQRAGVTSLLHSLELPLLDDAPVVTMRLMSVKGRSVTALLAEKAERKDDHHPDWALRREYRSTYRDDLRDGESIVAGTWVPQVAPGASSVPVSLEEDIAGHLGAGLDDTLVFDVQGESVTTTVASLRRVEWRRIQPNFFVVFPRGVLEEAPAMHVMVTRVASGEASAAMQRAVVTAFPNVSVIDLRLVLRTVDEVLGRMALVIRFMAIFTVLTGLIVLVSALVAGRYQRIQESVLLRMLGASGRQVLAILAVEYFALGLLAALTGIALAWPAAWALATFAFKVAFAPSAAPLLVALAAVPALTVVTGLLMSRDILRHPPLAILRTAT
jgi:putative ABC transport system permease protein